MKRVWILLACLMFASPACGQMVPPADYETPEEAMERDNRQFQREQNARAVATAPVRQVTAIESVAEEVKELRKEIALLRALLEKLVEKTAEPVASEPQTRRVLKQVRPFNSYIGGGVDDGMEWVEVPVR